MAKFLCTLALFACFMTQAFDVPYTAKAPTIDGLDNETQWALATWHPMQYLLVGSQPSQDDFSGRFRLLWDEQHLYLQAEIVDDVLIDRHANPLTQYWDDDCLEIFIDEDGSGGNHQFNHNAFAYHIALDNQAVDLGQKQKPRLYNSHLTSSWRRSEDSPNKIIWEVAIKLHSDQYQDDKPTKPVSLTANKQIGFMLAYCDNDGSEHREHFMASVDVKPLNGDKNRGWIDASVFGKITLASANEQ